VIHLDLPSSLSPRLSQGHPWVYRNHVSEAPPLHSGTWVQVRSGSFTAYGLWDEHSAIAVRLFSRQRVPDSEWLADRVREAWEARAPVRRGQTTAYRWIYGEGDGLPGIVVDLYGEYAVLQTFVSSVEGLVPCLADTLHAHTRLQGIVWRPAGREPRSLWGRLPPPEHTVEENGLLFRADLLSGQKTGLYFDQRENRHALSAWCQGETVLDCFCYTGAFSVYAARAGAAAVTACDVAAPAVDAARSNFSLNGFNPGSHSFVVGDCFQVLSQLAGENRRFGIVILDPPSLARDKKSRPAALRAYVRLNRLALRCVAPGGLLASASCTSQVSPDAFRESLTEAARQAGRRLLILHEAGHASDHPVPAHFPEGRYLKFVVARSLPLA
jgi:23S rRNA (cytosine1962-C5)-methyltransferase